VTPRSSRPPRRPGHRAWRWAAGTIAVLAAAVGAGELAGWPWLAGPVEQRLGDALGRPVQLGDDPDRPALRIRFLGGLRAETPRLTIAGPQWTAEQAGEGRAWGAEPLLDVRQAALRLSYFDLWRAWHDRAPLNVRHLGARRLDTTLVRLKDGTASWDMGSAKAKAKPGTTQEPVISGVHFDSLVVDDGRIRFEDVPQQVDLDARFAINDRGSLQIAARQRAPGSGSDAPSDPSLPVGDPPGPAAATFLKVRGEGHYRGSPLKLDARTLGALPILENVQGQHSDAVPLTVRLEAGSARVQFDGRVRDALHGDGLLGSYEVRGPSLASVGAPFGLTLPSTPPFHLKGRLARDGEVFSTVVDDAVIGRSALTGAFRFDVSGPVPTLSGRLAGDRLYLADLAPAVGVDGTPTGARARQRAAQDRVIPASPFDLPSLTRMDANVDIRLRRVDLGRVFAETIRPLEAHLTLRNGTLRIDQLDARTASGAVAGWLQLKSKEAERATWSTDLQWSGLDLARWVSQERKDDAPPYLSGQLRGRLRAVGSGDSTAAILANLDGSLEAQVHHGHMSHLVLEAAGLDLAQAVGTLFTGDQGLDVRCGAVKLAIRNGDVKPELAVIDTPDSTAWLEGWASLANETMSLQLRVAPRDFSPLTLREPIKVAGTFAHPDVSISDAVTRKAIPAVLLGLVHPIASLLPLIDLGNDDGADRQASGCKALVARAASVDKARNAAGTPRPRVDDDPTTGRAGPRGT